MKTAFNILLLLLAFNIVAAQTTSKLIYSFDDGKIPSNIQNFNSKCGIIKTKEGYSLLVKTAKSNKFSGVSFNTNFSKTWNFSNYAKLVIKVTNFSDDFLTIWASIKGCSKKLNNKLVKSRVPEAVTLSKGKSGLIELYIYAFGKKLSTDEDIISGRGLPIGTGDLDPSKIKQIMVYVKKTVNNHDFSIDNISLEGSVEVINTNDFFPFIDSLGQYIHDNWPGKTKSINELVEFANKERKSLENTRTSNELDVYGGWKKGGKYKATGYFRVQKIDGKWWLIDPYGYNFFSHGVNGVGEMAPTPTDFRENYFEYLPSKQSEFSECWSIGNWAPHGYYKNHIPYNQFDFLKANLKRKYGKNWKEQYKEITNLRFKSWGINTLGNWSQSFMYEGNSKNKIPYVVSGTSNDAKTIEGSRGWWRKFPDPFDKSFRKSIRKSLEKFKNSAANDPFCIGFFIDNEQSWGDDLSLSLATLRSPEKQSAKIAFINDIKVKYKSIKTLNSSWKSNYNSWEQLLKSTIIPDTNLTNVKIDLVEFYTKLTKEYFSICKEEVKRIAPNQMYLGCRFSAEMMDNDVLQLLAAKYCDIITYNIYNLLPVGFSKKIDKPVFIGEFHFGALDRGMFHTGLWFAKNQKERAALYYNFVLNALKNPLIVGTHWFKYPTEPLIGRGDGENFQIGFTDICDKPYPELINAEKKISSRMYQIKNEEIIKNEK